ncbi:MAG TPA: hypothetical protein VN895_01340 [Candidatus Acidoferrum sp.]|nr:hypothetical protein [Candidatus Acidoferrum sp.]
MAALVHSRGAPPIYDGIGPPVEPYRWESPPPNLRAGNQPPLSGKATLQVANGQVSGGTVKTGDGQVVVFVTAGAYAAPQGSTGVTCTIVPESNPPSPPVGMDLRGNVYRIACTAQPGSAAVTVSATYHVTLRFPPGAFKEIQGNDGTGWRPLQTVLSSGGQPYAGVNAAGFGEYAATAPTRASGESVFTVIGRYLEFWGILAFIILFGAIAVIQELRRRRHRVPAGPKTP